MDNRYRTVVAIGCGISILLLLLLNVMLTPQVLWFHYLAFFLILWPVSLFLIQKKRYTLYAYFCSILLIFYMIIENLLHAPKHPWFLYAGYPLIWWPITVSMGKRAKTVSFAWFVALITIIYYSILNIVLSPIHPWVIYPSYLILWWPCTLYYVRRKNYFGFSVAGSTISILFFALFNLVTSPQIPWAIFPIFLFLWWPLSMYYFSFLKQRVIKRRNAERSVVSLRK